MASSKGGRLKEAMSTRDSFGGEVRVLSEFDSSKIDLMRAATWSPMRFGRVLPMMTPIFLGARAEMGA